MEQAPFIPPGPDEEVIPEATWRVFGSGHFFRLWIAQVLSSLGDWIGLLAILAIANRVSQSNAAALSLVMVARMLPGFLLAPVCGALVDRWDRKRVMVVCDLGRAAMLALLPFVDSLTGLVLASFALEVLTLFWGPAKDASVPHLVPAEYLTGANSLSLIAAFGTFPLGALVFASLAGLTEWLSGFDALADVNRESLALLFDAGTFLASALVIAGLPIRSNHGRVRPGVDWGQTWRDIKEGVRFIAGHELVRGVMIGLSGGSSVEG
ncbi:MAG: MFS transporter [Acidimicrobiia bacterium]|nr:MFS transporter [Acidimicrobiia bacterium]